MPRSAWTAILLFVFPHVGWVTGCTPLLAIGWDWDWWIFCSGWSRTTILWIAVSLLTRITGLCLCFCLQTVRLCPDNRYWSFLFCRLALKNAWEQWI
jgi:hypothetical protein